MWHFTIVQTWHAASLHQTPGMASLRFSNVPTCPDLSGMWFRVLFRRSDISECPPCLPQASALPSVVRCPPSVVCCLSSVVCTPYPLPLSPAPLPSTTIGTHSKTPLFCYSLALSSSPSPLGEGFRVRSINAGDGKINSTKYRKRWLKFYRSL